MIVDDEHPFDHAGEDGFHPGAVRGEVGGALADFPRRGVECARDRADFVIAVVARRA